MKRITSLLIFVMLLLLMIEPISIKLNVKADNSSPPHLICRKVEFIEATYSPNGKLLSKRVSVRFEIYNNGSSPLVVDVIDRVRCINTSTFTTLYGTPKYDNIENFGNLTRITWKNIKINASKSLRFYYTAETFRKIPVSVNSTLYINDVKANVTGIRGFYTVSANISDTLTFELTLQNTLTPLYISNNKTLVQPLMCTVTVAFQNDYFSGVRSEPKANSTSFMGNKIMPTWILFLEDKPRTVKASASIIEMSEWGEVPLEPISVQITSAPEMLETYIKSMTKNLELQSNLMQNFTQVFGDLSQSTFQMYSGLQEIADSLQKNSTQMFNMLINFLNYTKLALQSANNILALSQSLIRNANSSLIIFMNNPNVTQLLLSNSTLKNLLYYTVGNMTAAYNMIDLARNGNSTVPGLLQICNQIDNLISQLDSANNATEQVVEGLYSLADGLYSLSNMTGQTKEELEKSLEELEAEKADLEDVLLTFNSKSLIPLDVEVKSPEFQPKWQIESNNTASQILSLNFTNNANVNLTVVGVALSFKSSTSSRLKFEVNLNGSWETVENPAYLGLEYNAENQTVYLWPMLTVAPNSTENVLVDWAGRPLRIIVENGNLTEVHWNLDIAVSYTNLTIESSESQFLCSFNQPHIIVQNITWTPSQPPPSPPPEKGPMELLIEFLQKPEVAATIIVAVAAIIFIAILIRRSRKRPSKIKLQKEDASKLLKEIEKLEKELSNQKG